MNYPLLLLGDCLDALPLLPAASVDAIVTDPPYGLSFMGKRWDYDVPSVEVWAECLRVLKPGGHLLAFAGTRTQHRMAVRIEDAGFEIRDMIAWVYGSGFPKSRNIAEVDMDGADRDRWVGWGTALKPALEPITVARKPLVGTVADNVLTHGTGALNIDGCRVHSHDSQGYAYTVQRMMPGAGQNATGKTHQEDVEFSGHTKDGRWPANLIHDGSDEVVEAFPQAKGQQGVTGKRKQGAVYGAVTEDGEGVEPRADTGSAARFFYCAKASRADRGAENAHPTVKPTDLMRYLCRLVTPPGGVVLDPFMGSGSTGKAAALEGFRFIGVERDADYWAIAQARVKGAAP